MRLDVKPLLLILGLLLPASQLYSQVLKNGNSSLIDSSYYLKKFRPFFERPYNQGFPSRSLPFATKKEKYAYNSRLSATNSTVCFDTSGRLFMKKSDYVFYSYTPIKTKDGHLLITGEYITKTDPPRLGGFLMKTDYEGTLQWGKLYDTLQGASRFHYLFYYKVLELSDGSLLLAGGTSNRETENDDVVLTKTNSTGDIIWTKIYKSRLWGFGNGSTDYFYVQQMKEDPSTGEIYFCGPFWKDGKSLVKVNQHTGDLIWSKSYDLNITFFHTAYGIHIRPNEILYFGSGSGNPVTYDILRINKQTGDTLQTRFYTSADTTGFKADILGNEELVQLSNGNFVISGDTYDSYINFNWDGVTPKYQASVIEFDPNLNVVKAFSIRSPLLTNGYNTRITIHPDGSGFFSMLEYLSGFNSNVYYVQFKNGQILKQRKRFYRNEGMPIENNSVRLPDRSDLIVKLLGDSNYVEEKIEFLKLHPSDSSSSCLGFEVYNSVLQPLRYASMPHLFMDSVLSNVFQISAQKTIVAEPFTVTNTPACRQISHCDSLQLLVSTNTLCLSNVLRVTARKNKECGSFVPATCDTSVVQSITYLNDSTTEIRFRKSWSGFVYAELQGCSLIKDSVFITVTGVPPPLNLGPDRELCAQNTLLLRAPAGYLSYQWQDGSADSTFLVTRSGRYHVTVKDACNNTSKDTVWVTEAPPVPLSVGPDRTKCNADTLQLSAPAGFLRYSWSPDYNASSVTAQTIVVNPLRDTSYFLQAEKTPGCFGFDTIRINVNTSPPVQLGNDRSFCSGDSVVLNAGAGFTSYLWNNVPGAQTYTLTTAGTYIVKATTADGCSSADTMQVLQVYANPVVVLSKDTTLCAGDKKILDAGAFSRYAWNTGATTQTIEVRSKGVYSVEVTDVNGCTASGTSRVTVLHSLPSFFLPNDTTICSYEQLLLVPANRYKNYLWSTGATTNSVTTRKEGLYWLRVTDDNNCTGIDSIRVGFKQCMQGFYMPTAFTPDGNGLNDVIKPLLFGNVLHYRFSIYNRWGQLVFTTNQLANGWDGIWKSVEQVPGTYSWTCMYQLDGAEKKQVRGTFELIR